ncbi:MAG: threonine synthase [Faecalibacterium sp.]|nr:threonine synthase [Ruminococcus sp.]MCM1393036.1 threonine synthase [Ruminococcus sp.]MCM1484958.1 threonine synthase [Faecalibacterium sp.]
MFYTSTRDKNVRVTSSQAIARGISADGGLFVPESIPQIDKQFIDSLVGLDYISRAKKVLSLYLTDFTEEEIDMCVSGAYAAGKFSSEKVAPLKKIADGANVLELWRGPTCAFKDMALQLLPYLLTVAAKKTVADKTIVILVATSGDTGKAALEGFKDVPGTKIMVFYPNDGVSPMQKLQMTTQEGGNVCVCAINGNFDDAQSGVKKIFTDKDVAAKLEENGMMFSSANSINWGRLVPQIVYYVSAYCDLIENGTIKNGDEMNVVVPTGNFGNILAAYYAKRMGIPVKTLICASNANNVLTDFLKSGTYDKNRAFYATTSPSMDILISSNLERLLFHLSDENDAKIRDWMGKLSADGKYEIDKDVADKVFALFDAGCCDDNETRDTIAETYKNGYLCDTHTAVAVKVYEEYVNRTGDKTETVLASTANPYKFSAAVLSAVGGEIPENADEFEQVDLLISKTGEPCPPQLANLGGKEVRFTECCNKEEMIDMVYKMLEIK